MSDEKGRSKDKNDRAFHQVDKKDWQVTETKIRNVILIGDSGSGKSTFIEQLKNPNILVSEQVISQTKIPQHHQLLVGNKIINIIDTPGFNEGAGLQRSNTIILNLISDYVRQDINKIHLLLFFTNSSLLRTNIKTISWVINSLGVQMEKVVGMVMTRSEAYDDKQEIEIVEQLNNDTEGKFVMDACQKGLLFSGLVDHTTPFGFRKQLKRYSRIINLMDDDGVSLFIQSSDRDSLFNLSQDLNFESNKLRSLLKEADMFYKTLLGQLNELRSIPELKDELREGEMLLKLSLNEIKDQNLVTEQTLISMNICVSYTIQHIKTIEDFIIKSDGYIKKIRNSLRDYFRKKI